MRIAANAYSTEFILATCQPSLGVGMMFGFQASYVRIENLAAVPIHYTLASTSPATTGDPELQPDSYVDIRDIPTYGAGISTTSTTTSTGDGGHRVTVAAFGGA